MSMKKEPKYFSLKDVETGKPDNFKLQLNKENGTVWEAGVFKRKRFLGLKMFEHWILQADLMEPIRAVDQEIQTALDIVETLKAKREMRIREAKTIMKTIPDSSMMRPLSFNNGPASKTVPVHDFFATDEKKKKPKDGRLLVGQVAGPENHNHNKNNNNQRKGT